MAMIAAARVMRFNGVPIFTKSRLRDAADRCRPVLRGDGLANQPAGQMAYSIVSVEFDLVRIENPKTNQLAAE